MAWQIPTLGALVTQSIRAINRHMPGADAALVRNNIHPTAKTLSGGLHGLYEYASWIAKQIFVRSADDEMLDEHGAQMKPPVLRRQPTRAAGPLTLYATDSVSIAAGDLFARSDDVAYEALEAVALGPGASGVVMVRAVVAGAAGNCAPAAVMGCYPLQFGSTIGIPGVVPPTLVAPVSGLLAEVGPEGLTGGADIEDKEAYRQRLIFARAFPDHGGAPPDYVRYVSAVPGVTRVFVEPHVYGRATVGVYPMFDDTNVDGFPSAEDIARVAFDLGEKAPGGAITYVLRAAPYPIHLTLTGVAIDHQDEIKDELRAMLARRGRASGEAIEHVSMPWLATPLTVPRQWLWETVAATTGTFGHQIVAPVADVVIPKGAFPVLGTVIFA